MAQNTFSGQNSDIPLYEIVATEIESGFLHKGTWAKAFSEANADVNTAKAIYLKLRVAQLPQEIEAFRQAVAISKRAFCTRLKEIARYRIPDMDHIPPERFEGNPAPLSQPFPTTELSNITGLLEFQIIDLIKAGSLRGVRSGGDWFVDGTFVGEPPQ